MVLANLTIGNSVCKLDGLTDIQFKQLRELLSYSESPTKSYYTGSYSSSVKNLMNKRGEFPTGLLYLVQEYFSLAGDVVNTIDNRRKPKSQQLFNLMLPYSPYPEQIEAAGACVQYERGLVVAPTGMGKSVIVALIIQALQVKTLVVVPSLELKRQLSESLKATFGSLKHITVQNIDGIDTKSREKYDCVIIDEFHHSGAKTYRTHNLKLWNETYYKFGLTATPFRSQSCENILLESVLSQVIYEVTHEQAVSKGYIVPMEASYIEVPKITPKGNTSSWPSMYSELVVHNEGRNNAIINLMLRCHRLKLPTIVLVKELAQGEALSAGGAFAFVNGQSDERHLIQDFNDRKINVLIGTEGVLSEGVDTRPTEVVIIAALGRSRNRFMQSAGRGFRVYPGKTMCKVILIKDKSHRWTEKHFKEQVKILKDEYGVIPTKLKVD